MTPGGFARVSGYENLDCVDVTLPKKTKLDLGVDFEKAAELRDRLRELKEMRIFV